MAIERTSSALEIAGEFARAYAEGEYERVRELVTEDVLQREINPSGYVEFRGPTELIDEAWQFTSKYGDPEFSNSPWSRRGRSCGSSTAGACDAMENLFVRLL